VGGGGVVPSKGRQSQVGTPLARWADGSGVVRRLLCRLAQTGAIALVHVDQMS
jgi:hypothetical protein